MSRIKTLLWIAVCLLLLPVAAAAENYGTAQATLIDNTALITANNIDASGTPAYAFDTWVQNIAGDTLDKPATERALATSSETVCFLYTINNTGNSSDSYFVAFEYGGPQYTGGASAWGFQIGVNGETLTWGDNANDAGDSVGTGLIAEDGQMTVVIAIGVGAFGVAPDMSTGGCSFIVSAETTATGQYTGDNNVIYAWAASDSGANNIGEDIVTVAGAAFSLSKVCTGASLGGVYRTDVVPGASLYYAIEFTNYGSGNGETVYITDTIDTSVMLFADSWIIGNAASDSPAVGGSGMRLELKTADNIWCWPEHAEYGNMLADPERIAAVRWEQDTLVPGSNAILHYRVTVK